MANQSRPLRCGRVLIRERRPHRLLTVAEQHDLDPNELDARLIDLAHDGFDELASLFPIRTSHAPQTAPCEVRRSSAIGARHTRQCTCPWARSRATRSSVGGWVMNSFLNCIFRPVSGLMMKALAWAGSTSIGTCFA